MNVYSKKNSSASRAIRYLQIAIDGGDLGPPPQSAEFRLKTNHGAIAKSYPQTLRDFHSNKHPSPPVDTDEPDRIRTELSLDLTDLKNKDQLQVPILILAMQVNLPQELPEIKPPFRFRQPKPELRNRNSLDNRLKIHRRQLG